MRVLTFVDAGVLIAAARGTAEISAKAAAVLEDPNREFVASVFLELELLPKPRHTGHRDELEYYETFFDGVRLWSKDFDAITHTAKQEALAYGLSALEALHVAVAALAGAELVTSSTSDKAIHRTRRVKVLSVRDLP